MGNYTRKVISFDDSNLITYSEIQNDCSEINKNLLERSKWQIDHVEDIVCIGKCGNYSYAGSETFFKIFKRNNRSESVIKAQSQ